MRLKEAVILWRSHAGTGSWKDLLIHGEKSPCWSKFAGRTCDPVGDALWSSVFLKGCTPWKTTTLEQFMKKCSLWEGSAMKNFMEDCLLWEGTRAGTGKSVRRREQQRKPEQCDNLTAAPIPCPSALLRGKVEKIRIEVESLKNRT